MKNCFVGKLLGTTVALMMFGVVDVVSVAWGAEMGSEPYFQGKTIRLIVPSSPGGGRDFYSRLLARSIKKYIPGNPTVVVMNMPGAGGEVALSYLYNRAKPDGLTMSHGTTSMYRNRPLGMATKYDLNKFTFVGTMPESAFLIVVRGDHPLKTFDELFTSKKPIFWGAETAGSAGTHNLLGHTMQLMGANVELVRGYRGTGPRRAALFRKEIDVTLERLATARPHLEEGTQRLLLVLTHPKHVPPELKGNVQSWSEIKLTPELRELSEFIITTSDLDKSFLLPPGVSPDRVAILRQAFDQAVNDPDVAKALEKLGAVGPPIRGVEMQEKIVPSILGISQGTKETVQKWVGNK